MNRQRTLWARLASDSAPCGGTGHKVATTLLVVLVASLAGGCAHPYDSLFLGYGSNFLDAAFNPIERNLLVTDLGRGQILAIDEERLTVAYKIPLQNPRHAALDVPNQRLYVLSGSEREGGPGTLVVVDLSGRTVEATIPLGRVPQALALHPSGKWVYVLASLRLLLVIDAAKEAIVDQRHFGGLSTGQHTSRSLAVDRTGDRLYAAGSHGHVVVIDTRTLTLVGNILAGSGGTTSVAVNPQGTKVYAVNGGDLVVVEAATLERMKTIDLPGGRESTSNPSGSRVYVALQSGRVASVNAEREEVEALINTGGAAISPVVDDVDARLYVLGWFHGTVAVVDTRANKLARTIQP